MWFVLVRLWVSQLFDPEIYRYPVFRYASFLSGGITSLPSVYILGNCRDVIPRRGRCHHGLGGV